jgi:hypothetical protein
VSCCFGQCMHQAAMTENCTSSGYSRWGVRMLFPMPVTSDGMALGGCDSDDTNRIEDEMRCNAMPQCSMTFSSFIYSMHARCAALIHCTAYNMYSSVHTIYSVVYVYNYHVLVTKLISDGCIRSTFHEHFSRSLVRRALCCGAEHPS